MRVIAGTLGGRNFDSPRGHKTHPMSEKMRGALFNALGDIEGFRVLDAYGGSGALSFEALSRGAESVVCIEVDKAAHATIDRTKKIFKADPVRLVRANAVSWSQNNPSERFDLVLCDPPYDDIKQSQLVQLATHVRPGGYMVLSIPKKYERPTFDGFDIERDKTYAEGSLVFYNRSA